MAEREKKISGGGKRYCVCCSNYAGKEVEGRIVKLHKLPSDKILKRVWERRLRLVRKDFTVNLKVNDPRVCSEHFVRKLGPKPGDSVPSVFKSRIFQTFTVSHSQTDMDEAQEFHAEPAQHSDSETMENEQPSVAAQHSDLGQTAFSVILHDYLGPVATSSICKATHVTVACPTKTNMTHTAVQTDTMVFTGMPLTGSGKSQASQTDENENPFTTLRYEHIFVNDETVRLYTGVQDVTTLQILFDEIPNIDDSNGWRERTRQ
ncbi:uncharacterized protein [Littorina saxatilis]|uniref:uncharacterized protein isoform X3 n=1 Tax=Littorina saxatilis TaxID=31220 RepID=UPI0038B5E524